MATNLVEEIAAKAAGLSPEQQREVLEFVNSILQRSKPAPQAGDQSQQAKPPFRSVMGILAHTGTDVTEEDIAEVRREMWKNFPREEPR